MPAAGDGDVALAGRVDEPEELHRRSGAVGVDEGDQVGAALAQRLHDHAALAQLRIGDHLHPAVDFGVAGHHLVGAVGAVVQRDDEAGARILDAGPVGREHAIDALLFVMGRWGEGGGREGRAAARRLAIVRCRDRDGGIPTISVGPVS